VRPVRAFGALLAAHLLSFLRSKAAFYWTLAFPLFFLFMFGFVFGRGSAEAASFLMPGLFTITLLSGSFFGVAMRMVTERETGVLRRLWVTPVHPVVVVSAHGATALVTLMLSLVLQGVIARLVFKITVAGSWVALGVVLVAGALALIPIGLITGSVARDSRSAPAIANSLFFPLMFLSGSAIPFAFLPGWMQKVARLIPTTYLLEALQGVMVRGEGLKRIAGPVAVLLLTSLLGVGLNGLLFRWESTEPVRKGRLAIALAGLGALYAGAYFLAPALRMSKPP